MTRRSVVYTVLRERANEWVTAQELVEAGAGWRYAARIFDLREDGHNIESRKVGMLGEYRLVIEDVAPGQTSMFGEAA